jgi:hypothetical protein
MNQWYQTGLFANRRPSFSRCNLGKSLCYAIVLIAMSTISWVPEGQCQACAQGKEFDTGTKAYVKCFESIKNIDCANERPAMKSRCAAEKACTQCKCKAVFPNGNLHNLYTNNCDWRTEGVKLQRAFLARRCCGD